MGIGFHLWLHRMESKYLSFLPPGHFQWNPIYSIIHYINVNLIFMVPECLTYEEYNKDIYVCYTVKVVIDLMLYEEAVLNTYTWV